MSVDDASQSATPARRIGYALKVVSIYAVVGPLIGLVAFAIGLSVLTVAGGKPDGVWLAPFFMIYGLPFAHFVGIPWAAIAGISAVALALALRRAPGWIGPLSGALSFLAAFASGAVRMPPGTASPEGFRIDDFAVGFTLLIALVHIVAAGACWWLARRMTVPGMSGKP